MRGQLTRKADVYSFGILLLEIVSGRCNTNKRLPIEEQYLLERVWRLFKKGELIQLVDALLGDDFNGDDACRFLKVSLLCTQVMPKSRPSMTTVVKLLTGEMQVDDEEISEPGMLSDLVSLRNQKNTSSYSLSAGSGNQIDSTPSVNTTVTHGTMTFTTIDDRNS